MMAMARMRFRDDGDEGGEDTCVVMMVWIMRNTTLMMLEITTDNHETYGNTYDHHNHCQIYDLPCYLHMM